MLLLLALAVSLNAPGAPAEPTSWKRTTKAYGIERTVIVTRSPEAIEAARKAAEAGREAAPRAPVKGPDVAELMRRVARAGSSEERRQALQGLGYEHDVRSPEDRALLLSFLEDRDPGVRQAAAHACAM